MLSDLFQVHDINLLFSSRKPECRYHPAAGETGDDFH